MTLKWQLGVAYYHSLILLESDSDELYFQVAEMILWASIRETSRLV